jgi:hypothetical protein
VIARGYDEHRSAWLGGEAHVRSHDGRSVWSKLATNRQHIALTLAFLAGAAIGSVAAVLACARKLSGGKSAYEQEGGTGDGT